MPASDFVDRLNYRVTPVICLILAVGLWWRLSSNDAVQCWTPAVFTSAMHEYAEAACRTQSSYYSTEDVQEIRPLMRKHSLLDWVALFVLLQGLIAMIPRVIWRVITAWFKGIDVDQMVTMSKEAAGPHIIGPSHPDKSATNFSKIGRVLHNYLLNDNASSILASSYVFVKILAHIVCLFQLSTMSTYLQYNNTRFGYEILKNISNGLDYQQSPALPKQFICDYTVRVLGNMHNFSLQCTSPGNQTAQRIFVFLWAWFAILAVLNLASALWWSGAALMSVGRRRLLNKFDAKFPRSFGVKQFGADAAFCLRMIDQVAGSLAASHVIDELSKSNAEHSRRTHDFSRPTSPQPPVTSPVSPRWNPLGHVSNHQAESRQNKTIDDDIDQLKHSNQQTYKSTYKPDIYPLNQFDVEQQDNNNATSGVYPTAPDDDDY